MCLTCDIIAGQVEPVGGVIYRDEYVVLHHCLDVELPGYLILSPRRHVEGFGDLAGEELSRLGVVANRAARALQALDGVEKVYLAGFGEDTAHFHLHIFPRYAWLPERHPEATNARGQLDGARLLSLCRERYRVSPAAMHQPAILEAVAYLRAQFDG